MPLPRVFNVSSFWLLVWSAALSWSWLLPNHYQPWSTFHMDAWVSIVLLSMAFVLSWGQRHEQIQLPKICVVAIGTAAIPWLQYAAGQLQFVGIAWVGSAYVLGFALAILVGQRWEAWSASQLGDGLLGALLIAAILSVGLQLHQWLALDVIDVWLMGNGGGRPYANVGQPNQLATLLLWGVIALWWFCHREKIGWVCAALATCFLFFGIALTASRTAWLGLLVMSVCAWVWAPLWPWRSSRVAVGLFAVFFIALTRLVPVVTDFLLLPAIENSSEIASRSSGMLRLQAWSLFIDAIVRSPWWGYGWIQGGAGQLAVAIDHEPLHILFQYSHNLFLDFLLWCGLPIGGALICASVAWVWRRVRRVPDAGSALLLIMLLVVGNHAMFEFPLHHAYMLLPAGLAAGALETRLRVSPVQVNALRFQWLLTLICALVLTFFVRDYMRIESSHQALRFERANFRFPVAPNTPEVILLDQLPGPIKLARLDPTPENASAHVDWMRRVAWIYPSAGTVHKLSATLAWLGRFDESATWLRRMCAVVPPVECEAVREAWKKQAIGDAAIARVLWPD